MTRFQWVGAGLTAAALGTTALSSLATQHIAALLSHHAALGKPLIGPLYQPFGAVLARQAMGAGRQIGVRAARFHRRYGRT
jgi:hypothetical protein